MATDAPTTPIPDAPSEPNPAGPEIVPKLQWLMFFRVVMVTVLLGATLAVNVNDPDLHEDRSTLVLLGLIIGTYALTIGYAILLPRVRFLTVFAYGQLVGDLLTTLVLVLLTGGSESIFLFMFSLVVMNAAILLYRRGALVLAAVSSAIVLTMLIREGFASDLLAPPSTRELMLSGLTNVSAVFLVALLAGYLSQQLRDTGQQLRFASEDIQQLRALNEHIITSIHSGLVSFTLSGQVIFFNPAAERITGYDVDQVLYANVHEFFPELRCHMPQNPSTLERWEEKWTRPDGENLVLGFSVSPLVDSANRHRGYIVVFQDLTPLREMEQAFQRSERFAAIGKMAAGIAHELRNPLASISGSIQMLESSDQLTGTNRRLMNIVLREIDRLDSLVTDFLKFARPSPPQFERIGLRDVLSEVIEVFAYLRYQSDENRHPVSVQMESEVDLDADPRQIKQLFWNLLNNAAEAMPGGGDIEVYALVNQGGQVEVRMIDHGVGIAHENIARIFDPFYSTKQSGTGLGLSLVHRIVEEHGGSMKVESAPEKGSTFVVYLPRARPDAARGSEARTRPSVTEA